MMKNLRNTCSFLLCIITAILIGCGREGPKSNQPVICVTNSWLECTVNDIAAENMRVVRLLPPGSCPGHFDISPRQVEDIRAASLLLRFHFQAGLDETLGEMIQDGAVIASITIGEGMCLPETYLASAEEVCKHLSGQFPEQAEYFRKRLKQLEERMQALAATASERAATTGIQGKSAVCSIHQEYFCRWLGMNVVAAFDDLNDVRPSGLRDILDKTDGRSVDFVIGNAQGSAGFANALAERLDAPVIVLNNFPDMIDEEDSFEELVMNNIEKISRAVEQ